MASQESRFVNYANDGQGGDLTWLQAGIDSSLALPHEGVATDHGSLGVFQQQWPFWGSMESLMDPARAAQKFYFALQKVPDWQSLPVTVAGQAVQISAFPNAYADDVPLAKSLLDDPSMANAADVSAQSMSAESGDCLAARVAPGTVSFPLPADAGYVDAKNWGASGGRWSHGHTGTDLSAACGTPVLAATGGTVIVRTDQPWSGRLARPGHDRDRPTHDLVRAHEVAGRCGWRPGRSGRADRRRRKRRQLERVPSALRGTPSRWNDLRRRHRPVGLAQAERRTRPDGQQSRGLLAVSSSWPRSTCSATPTRRPAGTSAAGTRARFG